MRLTKEDLKVREQYGMIIERLEGENWTFLCVRPDKFTDKERYILRTYIEDSVNSKSIDLPTEISHSNFANTI